MSKDKDNPEAEKPAKPPKAEKPEKAEKAERGEGAQKGDGAPKGDKPAKGEKPPKGEKGDKPPKGDKGDKPAKGDKAKGKKGEPAEPEGPIPTPRLQEKYFKQVLPTLAEKFGRKNLLALPRLEKIVVNMGVGAATQEKKHLETAAEALGQITGQKPIITKARQAISAFRLREGMPIGCKVTLRGRRMYEFMDRLVSLALPRVRDFRGINRKAFDGNGSYSLGLSEQLVFPELNPDKFTRVQGMNITFVVRNATDDESRELLSQLGMPFQADEAASGKKK